VYRYIENEDWVVRGVLSSLERRYLQTISDANSTFLPPKVSLLCRSGGACVVK
jgi:hypothetical protein